MTGVWFFLISMAATMSVAPAAGQGRVFPFVDEGPKRPDFVQFRAHVQEVVRRRDVDALLAIVGPEISLSFGIVEGEGLDRFRRFWCLGGWRSVGPRCSDPDMPPDVWKEL